MPGLFYYKLLFITEILVIEFLLSFRNKKKNHFLLRLFVSMIICYAVAVLFPIMDGVSYSSFYSSMMFITLFMVTICSLKFIYEITWKKIFFVGITAYTAQHISYEIFTLFGAITQYTSIFGMYTSDIIDFSSFNVGTFLIILIYLGIYVMVYLITYLTIGKKTNSENSFELNKTNLLFISCLILAVDIIINSIIIYSEETYTQTQQILYSLYNVMCCTMVLYIQSNMITIKDMKNEIEIITQLLKQSQKQYEISKENIEMINLKCHDIKHQVNSYIKKHSIDEEELQNINDVISIYDSIVKTGNETLDIILTEKSLICKNKDIVLTCMTDCKELTFIKDSDLYALFGNIMDNAIEATSCINIKEKRCIALNIHSVGKFITVTVKNYYNGTLKFSNEGLPLTNKEDKTYHGYGLKSIQAIVQKYGGTLSISTEEQIFKLNMLFPVE